MRGSEGQISRKRAFLAVLPFLLLGLADVVLLLEWGLDPLWGFMILPPILFISVIGWIAFRSGFTRRNIEQPGVDDDREVSYSEESQQNAGEEI
jgi:phosphotransferase system  glucose/maltose/N-acetylglucosamine-specific IIC component